jgi:hypothetical protein
MPTRPGRDRAKEWRWRRLLRQWRRSGLTGRAFCAIQQLSEPSFYSWKREIARRDQERRRTATKAAAARQARSTTAADWSARPNAASGPGFVRVALPADDPRPSAIEVVVGQGRVVRVRAGFDDNLLRQLLRVLEEPSC